MIFPPKPVPKKVQREDENIFCKPRKPFININSCGKMMCKISNPNCLLHLRGFSLFVDRNNFFVCLIFGRKYKKWGKCIKCHYIPE